VSAVVHGESFDFAESAFAFGVGKPSVVRGVERNYR